MKTIGIELIAKLNFDEHVFRICQKVARQINVFLRSSNFLSEDFRQSAFNSFVRSGCYYCPDGEIKKITVKKLENNF